MQKLVWTSHYAPFRCGGDVHAPIGTELEVSAPVDLGGGYSGHLVTAPFGETFVAEAETGAFVGPSIKQVHDDIAAADPDVMREQMRDAKRRLRSILVWSEEDFWGAFRHKVGADA